MSDILLIKFLHLVGFGYWIGADLAVFYSSYYVLNEELSPEVRTTTAKILFALDQVPRFCMTLSLALGIHLAWRLGMLPFSATLVVITWIVCLAWLTMVIVLHAADPGPRKVLLTRVDFWFRVLMALTLLAAGFSALAGTWATPDFIAWKLAIFGGLISCGLIVRIKLKDFGPAFAAVASGNVTDDANATLRRSLGGTRPFVVLIWIGLLASAALGVHLI